MTRRNLITNTMAISAAFLVGKLTPIADWNGLPKLKATATKSDYEPPIPIILAACAVKGN